MYLLYPTYMYACTLVCGIYICKIIMLGLNYVSMHAYASTCSYEHYDECMQLITMQLCELYGCNYMYVCSSVGLFIVLYGSIYTCYTVYN